MAPGTGGGHVDGRAARGRAAFAAVVALVGALALAGCGAGDPDPYAVVDQARTATYDRFQVNLGLTVDVDAQTDIDFPNAGFNGMSINIPPEAVMFAADVPAKKAHIRVAVPADALGTLGMSLVGPGQALDFEALSDGSDVYLKSSFLPMALGGIEGAPIQGDLTGWVRVGGVDELMALGALAGGDPGGMLGIPTIPEVPLPSPGDAASLRTLLTDLGTTLEYAGTETINGAEHVHLKGGVNIVSLVRSQRFLSLTGMPPEAVQGIAELEGTIGIATDIWVNKSNGRLATLRVEGTSTNQPAVNLTFTVQVAEPGADITFAAPPTFTDIDLAQLIGNPFGGIGVEG